MNVNDFDRALRDWFDAEAQVPAPRDGLRMAIVATRNRRPRTAWLARPGSRWVSGAMDSERPQLRMPDLEVRWSTALLAGLLLLGFGIAVLAIGALLVRRAPAPSDLGRLTYSLDGDIYLADWDGGHPTRIADGSSTDGYRFPRWSPDGRHLSYERWNSVTSTVFVTDQTGSRLASFPGFWSSWSPDSTRIAVCCSEVFSIDGTHQAHVSHEPADWQGTGDQYAGWTADSGSLVVSLARSSDPPESEYAVLAIPIDGGAPRRIGDGQAGPNNRIASPDGKKFAIPASHIGRWHIQILDQNGVQLAEYVAERTSELEFAWGGGDIWSPGSNRIVFGWAWDSDAGPFELRVMDASTGGTSTLLKSSTSMAPLRWAPDGQSLLFVQPNIESGPGEPSAAGVWRIGMDGSEPVLVVQGTSDADWQWLPAGPR
jgi:Tol biopolymer transport system component